MNVKIPFDPHVFYSRQTVLHELGPEGQKKLKQSKVAVVGVGGLGSVSALYLALAGVGFMRLIDQDTVELRARDLQNVRVRHKIIRS